MHNMRYRLWFFHNEEKLHHEWQLVVAAATINDVHMHDVADSDADKILYFCKQITIFGIAVDKLMLQKVKLLA